MSSKVEIAIEQLVYDVAAEVGLTEFDERRLDVAGIAGDALRGIRIAVRKHVYEGNRTLEGYEQLVSEYLLPDPKIVDLEAARRRLGEHHGDGRPVS